MSRCYDIMDFTKEIVVRNDVKVEMGDFQRALAEVKPQFGIDEEKFDVFLRGRLYDYGKRFYKIMHTLEDAVNITKNGRSTKLNSVLLEGEPGTGKTSIAAYFGKKCSFSYVKLVTPESFVGYSESGKIAAIVKIFEDAYRSPEACIIIDNLERLVEFVDIGPRFNNHMLQAILVLIKRLPKNVECKLLLIATTSCASKLQQLEIPGCFTNRYAYRSRRLTVPMLEGDELQKLLTTDLKVAPQDAAEIGKFINKSPIKKFLQVKDMAGKGGPASWKEAWEAFDDINF